MMFLEAKETRMRTTRWRGCLPVFAVTLLLTSFTQAKAQGPNLALNKPVIDQSSDSSSDIRNGNAIRTASLLEWYRQQER